MKLERWECFVNASGKRSSVDARPGHGGGPHRPARHGPCGHGAGPRLRAGDQVLVIAHGNSLRALCRVLDVLSEAEVESLNIPTGQPLLYRFTPSLMPLVRGGQYLNPMAAKTAAALVAAAGGT